MKNSLSKTLQTELYRKALHLSSLWMPLFIGLADRNICILLFLFLFAGNLAVEYAAYRKIPVIGELFRRMFFKTLRPKEVLQNKFVPSGSVYILLSALICSVCFARTAAVAALTVMLVSDTCAALSGRFFGTFRFANGKSAEGTAAFFVSAFIILSALAVKCPLPATVFIAAGTAAAELWENRLKIDDNLSVSLITGFILNLFYL